MFEAKSVRELQPPLLATTVRTRTKQNKKRMNVRTLTCNSFSLMLSALISCRYLLFADGAPVITGTLAAEGCGGREETL